MPTFFYKVKDKNGKDIKGTLDAKDKKQALQIIREKGLFCYDINEKNNSEILFYIKKFLSKSSLSDVSNFTRQLATMIGAGLPLTQALTILSTQTTNKLADITKSLLVDIKGGAGLSDAMEKFPKIFSPVYIGLVRAGEAAGVLNNILLRLADNLETQREFRAKIKGAMIYPIIILIGMGGVAIAMMILVIPKMMAMFSDFGGKLPPATQALMNISGFFSAFWWMFALIFIAAGYGYKTYYATKPGRRVIDRLKFKIPIVGKLTQQVVLTEFCRTLGLLVGVGVSIVDALEITSKVTDNFVVEESILEINQQVVKGFSLASATNQIEVFPQILSQMLAVGEATGKLDEVLLKISKYFQSESEEALKTLTTAIEPLIMFILGIGVLFLVIAVIMPIYSLTNQFQ